MEYDHERLDQLLTQLRLSSVRDKLDNLLDEAARQKMNFREMLQYLFEHETANKGQKRLDMAMRIAKFPYVRTLEQFDFEAQPSLEPGQLRELGICRWIANGDTLLFLGPPGVGKTHLAVALGREAVRQGYSVLFVSAASLMAQLSKAHQEGRLEEKLTNFGRVKLLIIDELGYLPFEANAAHLFFQLVAKRYEKGSTLITSNRSVGEWGEVFGDSVVATAILDRLLHHSHVITIKGESYRMKEKKRAGHSKALQQSLTEYK